MRLLVSLLLVGINAITALDIPKGARETPLQHVEVYTEVLTRAELIAYRAAIQNGAGRVSASIDLAAILGVAPGDHVPGKVARGPVSEHQDKFADAAAVSEVALLYLGLGSEDTKFVLRDTHTDEEHAIALEPNLLIKYQNAFYSHRVEAPESSERVMLGPASMRGGVLEAVGNNEGPFFYDCCAGFPEMYGGLADCEGLPLCKVTGVENKCFCGSEETLCEAYEGEYGAEYESSGEIDPEICNCLAGADGGGASFEDSFRCGCTSDFECIPDIETCVVDTESWSAEDPPDCPEGFEEFPDFEDIPFRRMLIKDEPKEADAGLLRGARRPLFGSIDDTCPASLEAVLEGPECESVQRLELPPCTGSVDLYCVDVNGDCKDDPVTNYCPYNFEQGGNRRRLDVDDAIYRNGSPPPTKEPSARPSARPSAAPSQESITMEPGLCLPCGGGGGKGFEGDFGGEKGFLGEKGFFPGDFV